MSSLSSEQIREALADAAVKSTGAGKRRKLASVRSSPGAYFSVGALATFLSLILLRGHYETAALFLSIATWTVVPVLVFTDRLSFDGQVLSRSGLISRLSGIILGHSLSIALSDVEAIQVSALRTLRRGGSVRYRYRVEVTANQTALVFSSGGRRFREILRYLLPAIPEAKMDARAAELREHLHDPGMLNAEVQQLGIASTIVLDASDLAASARKNITQEARPNTTNEDIERARQLRKVANNLRLAGRLRESAEAFRRALLVTPRNAGLIYEYARLLRSQASALGDARMLRRSGAALRLAVKRDNGNTDLLTRIGESLLEQGHADRARKVFRRALEISEGAFRAQLGLAEASLSEGKLAHVIHHFSEAARIAPDKATVRFARREAEYYARLNDDDDYLAAELRRMNWLHHISRIQQFAARVSFASLLVALLGASFNQGIAGIGWALASSSVIAWSSSLVVTSFLSTRKKIDAVP